MPQCSDDVRDINLRLGRVEQDIAAIKTAFLLNDRNTEDYDGHRNDHRTRLKQAEAVEDYKQAATKKIIMGAIAVFLTILSLGIGPYLRGFFGGG